jgi:hypothetical protein
VTAGIVLMPWMGAAAMYPRYAVGLMQVQIGSLSAAKACRRASLSAALGCSKRRCGVGGVASKLALDKLKQVDETIAQSGDH